MKGFVFASFYRCEIGVQIVEFRYEDFGDFVVRVGVN